jgi:universal stress protein A
MNGTYYKHILARSTCRKTTAKVIREGGRPGPLNSAKLSVIHVDVDLRDLYTEMIDIDIDNVQDQVIAEAKEKLEAFLASVDYPIEKKLVICGDLSERVNQAVRTTRSTCWCAAIARASGACSPRAHAS